MRNPLAIALKGKGLSLLFDRVRSITQRYGITAGKMKHSLAVLQQVCDEFSCQPTLPVTSVAMARHTSLVKQHQAAGVEFAIHGLVHVDHKQLSLDAQTQHLTQALQLFADAGIAIKGFRAPYLRWNDDLLTVLNKVGLLYDSSQAVAWDVDASQVTGGYEQALDFYGAKPSADFLALPRLISGLVQIPYSLPDDEALVERLNLVDHAVMSELWTDILQHTYETGEIFTIGLHPERAILCRDALWATLQKARSFSPPVWIARLDQVAVWWKSLSMTTFSIRTTSENKFDIEIKGPSQAKILVRAIEPTIVTHVWRNRYATVDSPTFAFTAPKRPFIGLSLDSDPKLCDFLTQQGYLVELSADVDAYAFYLDQLHFSLAEARSLLNAIESGDWPLIRVARWPDGAQSALSITGDLDGFTLGDYAWRFMGR